MSQEDQRAKSKERRIDNLRKRLRGARPDELPSIILGLLDLLADEL